MTSAPRMPKPRVVHELRTAFTVITSFDGDEDLQVEASQMCAHPRVVRDHLADLALHLDSPPSIDVLDRIDGSILGDADQAR